MSTIQHSEACCALPPFTGSNYKPTGTIERIPGHIPNNIIGLMTGCDFDVYVTGKKDAEIGLVCIYGTALTKQADQDIFGFMNPTQQGADILASQLNCCIAMPDIFRGKPWELSRFPPPDRDEFLAWIGATQWPQVEPILAKTIDYLKGQGAKKCGTSILPSHVDL